MPLTFFSPSQDIFICESICSGWDFPGGSEGKESACNVRDGIQSLGREDPLEEGVATHSSILVWRIPWREEPEGL